MPNTLSGAGVPNPEAIKLRQGEPTQSASPEAGESPVVADERVRETLAETKDAVLHAEQIASSETTEQTPSATAQDVAQQSTSTKDEVTIEVEKVLEEGLGPFYSSLPPEAKPLFKKKGEEASQEISEMVRTLHVNVKRILQLIHAWLRTIPGVNKFFLEQEAKIKTDRIMELAEARKEDVMNTTG